MIMKLTSILLSLISVASSQEICSDNDECGCTDREACSSLAGFSEVVSGFNKGCFQAKGNIYFSTGPTGPNNFCYYDDCKIPDRYNWLTCSDPITPPPTSPPPTSPPTYQEICTDYDECGCTDREKCESIAKAKYLLGFGAGYAVEYESDSKSGCFQDGRGYIRFSSRTTEQPGCPDPGCDLDSQYNWISCSDPTPISPYDCKDEDRKSNMGEFAIGKVGKTEDADDKSFPFGKVFFVDEAGEETVDGNPHRLIANIYLEFDKDKLKPKVLDGADEQGEEGNSLLELIGGYQEVYVNVPEGDKDCKTGGTLVTKPFFKSENLKIRDYNYAKFNTPIDESTCFPSTKTGRVTRVNVAIKDPLSAGSPIVTGLERNIIDFCYRVGYTIGEGDKKTLVNFKDTKVRGVVTVEGIFGNFDQAVEIVGPDATEIDTSVRTKVEVEVFLCNIKNVGTKNVRDRQYQIGQNFRLCVKSSNDKYEVEKFKDVSCGTRQLVSEGVAFDDLSEIFLDDNGELIEDSIAVKSVITATIITEGTKDGSSILCQGEVTLKKKDGTIVVRNLQEISSGSEADDDESLETPFELKITLATPTINLNKSIESSASLPSSITTTAVAVIGFVVALFL